MKLVADGGMDGAAGARRMRDFQLPSTIVVGETVDLLARLVDEPKERRKRLFPLLSALYADGTLSPQSALGTATEMFCKDAFADPDDIDPPDLGQIVLSELLPALRLRPGNLLLPACLRLGGEFNPIGNSSRRQRR